MNKKIIIDVNGEIILGNTSEILLEQLEHHHINISSSCRSAICEQCCVTLYRGTVKTLNGKLLQGHRKILSCNCIPMEDIKITFSSKKRMNT